MTSHPKCSLCHPVSEQVLWADDEHRIVLAAEPDYPGFMRVIVNQHVAEMTDLSAGRQRQLLDVLLVVEAAIRVELKPEKVNWASLGNYVPHLHWHVIPRFKDDATWPDAVWASKRRESPHRLIDAATLTSYLTDKLGRGAGPRQVHPS